MVDKRQKRWKRENRASKQGTWACSCGARHLMHERCPIPRRTGNRALDVALARVGVR